MKKLIIALVIAMAMAPFTAFGLEMMNDSNLKDTTGQAGVSIAIDDVVLYSNVEYTRYIDADGNYDAATGVADANAADDGAYLQIGNVESVKTFNAILDDTNRSGQLQMAYVNIAGTSISMAAGGNHDASFATRGANALSIDIGYCNTLSAGKSFNLGAPINVAGVIIGLPTLEIWTASESKTISVHADGSAQHGLSLTSAPTAEQLITIETGNKTMAILGGVLEIAPH